MKNSSHCREFNLGSLKRGPVHAGSPAREHCALESDPLSSEDLPAPSGLRLGMHHSIVIVACGRRQSIAVNGAWGQVRRDSAQLSDRAALAKARSSSWQNAVKLGRSIIAGAIWFSLTM